MLKVDAKKNVAALWIGESEWKLTGGCIHKRGCIQTHRWKRFSEKLKSGSAIRHHHSTEHLDKFMSKFLINHWLLFCTLVSLVIFPFLNLFSAFPMDFQLYSFHQIWLICYFFILFVLVLLFSCSYTICATFVGNLHVG